MAAYNSMKQNKIGVIAPEVSTAEQLAIIAANRFSLGAKVGELDAAKANPQRWLESQLRIPQFDHALPTAKQALAMNETFRQYKDKLNQAETMNTGEANLKVLKDTLEPHKPRVLLSRFMNDSLIRSIESDNGFAWRLLDFYSNHFSVSSSGGLMMFLAPTLEREALAPLLFGKFEDMLLAVTSHPAMLVYLNNENSYGPNSKIGRRHTDKGLNENLAREILELHTLGVNGGYQQADVIELAKAISGWSVNKRTKPNQELGFTFRAAGHEPGDRQILGKTYTQKDIKQGIGILRDLAKHPATAKHISTKLARHFLNDSPPESLIKRLTERWIATDGNLREVTLALIHSPEMWEAPAKKYKTPREFVISACRTCDFTRWERNSTLNTLAQLGQKPFNAGSPAGYADTTSAWDGAEALQSRIEWASQAAKRTKVSAKQIAYNSMGNSLSHTTKKVIEQAESQSQARALFLLSPDFLRR